MYQLLGAVGEIIDDTDPVQPTVRMIQGDTGEHAATNFAHGYTPVEGDIVLVLSVDGGARVVIGVRDGAPTSS